MSRRSIRQYKPQAVNRDTMQIILDCGINAPNGQNKQSWEVRVVDNPDFINGITEIYKKEIPKPPKTRNSRTCFATLLQ
jgi:Nitroreductase